MFLLFTILLVLSSALLGLIVLIQNPKGGGLSGTFGGVGTQLMGVKQTTDVLEKGTWIFAALVGLLCLFSTVFIKKDKQLIENLDGGKAPVKQGAPAPKK